MNIQSYKLNLAMYNKSLCGVNLYEGNPKGGEDKGLNSKCHHKKVDVSKSMGGVDISITSEPWSVQIYNLNKYVCGGTLVSRNYVMTAAHCIIENCYSWNVSQKIIQKFDVLINFPGDETNNYLDKNLDGFQLPFIRRHIRSILLPSISNSENIKCNGKNDFAIFELDKPVPEGYGYACIPIYHPPMYTIYSSDFYVVGYGRNPYRERRMMLTQNKALKNILDQDNLLTYDRNKIQKLEVGVIFTFPGCRLKPSIPADKGYICVYDKIDEGICDGDSGSGLFKKHKDIKNNLPEQAYIVGVVSKAVPCSEGRDWVATNYQLYTDVFQQRLIYEKLFSEE
uniref:Peptidase S1 domain-containing protein n=1 Tax=Strongyloides venezuelensis TaxID=75913 RepID=A0A0K0F998_STRVS